MTTSTVDPRPASRHERADEILRALGDWLRASPGREVRLGFTADGGWRAELSDLRAAGGETLTHCLAQVATVASLESAEDAGRLG